MKNVYLFLLFAVSLNAQSGWQTQLAIPDTSLWSTELVRLPDGDVLLLGRREYHDLFAGIPFEGYVTYGSYLARIDAAGQVVWEQKDLPTGFLTAPEELNAQGRLPGPSVLIDPVAGTWQLPYTVYAGYLDCEAAPGVGAFSTLPGLLRGSLSTGAVLSDTVYADNGECGIEYIVRAFRSGEVVLALSWHQMFGLQLMRFDNQDGLTRYPLQTALFSLQDAAQDPITGELLVLGDDTLGQIAVLRTDAFGTVEQSYVLSDVLLRLQALSDGSGYLGMGLKSVGDSLHYTLHRYDAAFNKQWSYQTLNAITSAYDAPDGATLVLEGTFLYPEQTFVRVVRLDDQGLPSATRDYAGENLFAGSILPAADSCFVFTRTNFDLFEHPVPASITVQADCLDGTSAAPEPPGRSLVLTLAPNPAVDQLVARWPEAAPADAVFEVRSADGRLMHAGAVGGTTGQGLTVGDWPRGVYVAMLRAAAAVQQSIFVLR